MVAKRKKNSETEINTPNNLPNDKLFEQIRKRLINFHTKNRKQKNLWDTIDKNDLIVAVGAAGTGKSLVAIAKALDLLVNCSDKFKDISILTPIVESGEEKLGALPGTSDEKIYPYHYSMVSLFKDLIGDSLTTQLLERELIKPLITAYLRGYTAKSTIFIIDEAQNLLSSGAKLILTRMGENSKLIFTADDKQIDLKNKKLSAIIDFRERFKNFSKMKFIEFNNEDIVRNPLISEILEYYENE